MGALLFCNCHATLIPTFSRTLNDARSREYISEYVISLFSHYTGRLPLSLFISLFIFSLGERTMIVRGTETDPPLEAVILVRERDAGEVSFGHCRLGVMLFWASTRLYLDETTLRELKIREFSLSLSLRGTTSWFYLPADCVWLCNETARKTVGEILFRPTIARRLCILRRSATATCRSAARAE